MRRYVDADCTFVELHHWDASVTEAFRTYGFEVMSFMREPAKRKIAEFSDPLV